MHSHTNTHTTEAPLDIHIEPVRTWALQDLTHQTRTRLYSTLPHVNLAAPQTKNTVDEKRICRM